MKYFFQSIALAFCFVFISCTNNFISDSPQIIAAISEIKSHGEFEKVDLNFDYTNSNQGKKAIKLKLHGGDFDDSKERKIAKKCAQIALNITEKTRKFELVIVSIVKTSRLLIFKSTVETKHVFRKEDLLD